MPIVGQKALAGDWVYRAPKPVHCDTRTLYITYLLKRIIANIFTEERFTIRRNRQTNGFNRESNEPNSRLPLLSDNSPIQ